MPLHQQVTTCRKGGGPVSKFCTCENCTLSVCSVCSAYEGGLTTDCPGSKVDFDRQREVYETSLDYTDDRGWYLGEPTEQRSPRFARTKLLPGPSRVDPRTTVAPSIDWTIVDRNAHLQHELVLKGIAWVLADRMAEDHSAVLTRLEGDVAAYLPREEAIAAIFGKVDLGVPHPRELIEELEHEKVAFHLACQRAEKCDDEFRQSARGLVAALEEGSRMFAEHVQGDVCTDAEVVPAILDPARVEREDRVRALRAERNRLKHGPRGSGERGACDPDCRKCAIEREIETASREGR